MVFLIQQTMIYAVPLMLVALAGVCAERSGTINLALEGIMIMGAFIGVMTVRILQGGGSFTSENGQLLMLIALIVSGIVGALFSLLLGFSAINLKADQTIGGTALNMLAPALVLFLITIIIHQNNIGMLTGAAGTWFMIKPTTFGFEPDHSFGILDVFINKVYPSSYVCILIFVIVSIFLYKTKTGLRLRACGENPQAADSLGINVYKMRYLGIILSGFLAGVGGFQFALTVSNCTSTGAVAGYGFLALAVMIFGNWTPINIAICSVLFGLFKCISATYATLDINGDGVFTLANLGISPYVYRLLPYVITLIVLAFTSKKSRVPKAEGIPYDKGAR